MRLLRSQTARWRSRPAGIGDLPCCYILLRVIGTIQVCVFEQEDDERFVDFRPKQWSGFLVNEGARRFECGDRITRQLGVAFDAIATFTAVCGISKTATY